MSPVRSTSSESSPVCAAPLRTASGKQGRVPELTVAPPSASAWFPDSFELTCAELHPVPCDLQLRGASPEDLLSCACAHGSNAHGFTPAWYNSERLVAMAAIIARRTG